MNCDSVRPHLSAWLDAEDAPPPWVRRHVEECSGCRRHREAALEFRARIADLRAARVPVAVLQAVRRRHTVETPHARFGRRWQQAAAAGVGFAIWLGVSRLPGAATTTPHEVSVEWTYPWTRLHEGFELPAEESTRLLHALAVLESET